MANLIFILYFV